MVTVVKPSILGDEPVDSDQVDVDTSLGRLKEPPVCDDDTLKKTAMTASNLSAWCFSFEQDPKPRFAALSTNEAMPVSSSSSTCTRESDTGALSDAESRLQMYTRSPPTKLQHDVSASGELNAKVCLQRTSRQGRSTQRWINEGGESVRLVTGCVPILRGGKILFVSASRKPEWILPKGGWETDEALQESAVRETFEEAGVLGMLGPKLDDIQYETRKAKKRRLEEFERLQKTKSDSEDELKAVAIPESIFPATPVTLTDEAILRIREHATLMSDETMSIGSTRSSNYSQVRLSLFPLYVSKVCNDWPESGRFRKAVDIDEALKIVENRPEFQAALVQVKAQGLHLRRESETSKI